MNEKYGFWLFVTSCMSGCGQMYQGYMKRGLSLLLLFFSLIALAGFLALGPIAFFLPVVWLYAFFDSYTIRGRVAAGDPPEDEYLFGLSDMDSQQMNALLRRRHSLIGWGLVFLGIYMFYDSFMRRLMQVVLDIPGLEWAYGLVVYDVPRLVLTLLIILLGVWFIRGPKQAKAEEVPIFTPPAEPAAPGAETAPVTETAPVAGMVSQAEEEEPYGDD